MPDQDNSRDEAANASAPTSASGTTPRELTDADRAKLRELDEQLEKFESQKRWSDAIRTVVAKASLVGTVEERVELMARAGRMYIERVSNQAEAIKCFEAVIELDRGHTEALSRLREMYDKRRDWERLIHVMRIEAEQLDAMDRPERYLEMARLATERVRKPEVCIELWQLVLNEDQDNPEALTNLAGLYERAREWKPLTEVLERKAEQTRDRAELIPLLQKLGMIFADKLTDDDGAVRTFRKLLEVDPDDRRAQEQLKKRYIALRDWDALEAFSAHGEKWDELIRTLEREVDGKETPDDEKRALLFRIARLWADKKQKADRAARCYEKVLELDATNLEAAVALTPIYEAAGDARKLVHALEVRLVHDLPVDERVELLETCARLYETKLRDAGKAFARALDAFKADPTREEPRANVERLAEATNGWPALLEAYPAAIEGAPSHARELRLRFGAILARVGQTETAIAEYRRVFDDGRDDPDAMLALERLYEGAGRHRELLDVLERRAELEADAEARKAIRYAIARAWDESVGDTAKAIDTYQSIIAEYGDDEREAYRALDRLFEVAERWDDLVATLEHRIDRVPDSEQELAALKFRLGHTLEAQAGDAERALDLYREVLALVPEHDGARQALERLLDHADLAGRAAEVLEPVYEARGDWERLVRSSEVSVAHTSSRDAKVAMLSRIGDILSAQIGDLQRAYDAYARAFREAPDDEEALARLERASFAAEKTSEFVALLEELAAKATTPSLGRVLWSKAANVHVEARGDLDAAVSAYSKLIESDPSDVEALVALEALYRRAARYEALVGVLRKRAELGTPEEQESLLCEAARILDEHVGRPNEAVEVYREILSASPGSAAAVAALDALFARLERWSDLADNLDKQLASATDIPTQTALMLRLAEVREHRMDAAEAAVETLREVLAIDPSNTAAVASLERLQRQPALELVVANILEPVYRELGDFPKLVGAHEVQARHAETDDRRVELLHQIAELREVALDDLGAAFQTQVRALKFDPANATTYSQLERLAASTQAYEALAQTFEATVEAVEDPTLAAMLHTKAARVREDQLGDSEAAIRHYQRVLELDAADLDAATALERLYGAAERYADLAKTHLLVARMLTNLAEQKERVFRAARISEEILERPTEAIDTYRKVLELDADDVDALDKLIELYLRLEQWAPLLEIYARKAELVSDADERKALFVEMGTVYEREVGDIDKAIDTYQRIREIDPDDLVAIGRLDALYQASGNWQELLAVLEREADLASDPAEVLSYKFRIADLWDHKLGDPTRGIDGYREILEVAPDHEPSLNALEALVSSGREAVAAANVLEPVYRAVGEWAKLAAIHEVQVANESDPVRRVELLHRIADLQENALDRARAAFDAYARALAIDPSDETTIANLERLAEPLAAWGDVVKHYDAQAARLRDDAPDRAAELALRSAQTAEVQLGDVDGAIARYRTVLEIDATHATALESLDRLYEAAERWTNLAEILPREMQIAATPDDVLHLQYRYAQTLEARLGDVPKAIEQYRDILAAAPEHRPALAALEALFQRGEARGVIAEILDPLYRMQEAWEPLIALQTALIEHESDRTTKVAMMHRVAELAEERAGDGALAFEWYQRALIADPTNDRSEEECTRLATLLDGWEALAHTYADILQASPSPEVAVHTGRALARVYAKELADTARAEEAYRFVLGIDERDLATLEALDSIYVEHGAADALAEVLRKRIAATEDPRDQVELTFRLGQLCEHDLGRLAEAIASYRRVIDSLDPQHVESIRALQNIYTFQQDWPNLYRTFEAEIEVIHGDGPTADVLAKMARLASEQLADVEKSIGVWKRVLELRGEDAEALNALGDLYVRTENWRDLVDVLEREVSITDDDALRARMYADLARIWRDKLGRDRNALENWERVLDLDPSSTDALLAMADIHRAASQWNELVETLHRVVDVGAASLENVTLHGVFVELGQRYEQLERPMDAVEAYRRAADVEPRSLDALGALERIHRAEAQWDETAAVLERRVDAVDGLDQKIATWVSVARVFEEQLGDRARAVPAYEKILELDPGHEGAFAALESIHTELEAWSSLVELYLQRVEASDVAAVRIDLLRRIARVYEKHIGNPSEAFDALLIAWSEDYSDETTAADLERLAAATRKWNELLNSANSALQEVSDPQLKIAICLRCAKWYGTELGHPEYALPYYRQILELDPGNVAGMRQMAELYRLTQQWPSLAQVLGRLVEATPDVSEKSRVLVQLGQLCEGPLSVPEQSATYFQKALELDPNDIGALDALAKVHARKQEWPELLALLERKAQALTDANEVLAARLEIAEAYEDRVQDIDRAIAAYRGVTEADPANLVGWKGLERLYSRRERWSDLLQALEAQVELVQTERERITLLTRIAGMWEEEFVKPDRAAERLEQVLDIDPTNDIALRGLARLYRQMQKWDELIAVLDRHVGATPDRSDKAQLFRQMGEVWSREKSDLDRAIDAYLNVLDLDEANIEALDALTRLYDRKNEPTSALDMMERLASVLIEPKARVDLRFRMGRLYEEKLEDRSLATDQYRAAIDLDPAHLPSLEALRKIQIDEGDWLGASRTLEQEAKHEANPRTIARHLVELGRLYDDKLDEHDRAVQCFAKALEQDADNEDAALPLARERLAKEQWADAVPLLDMLNKRAGRRSNEEQLELAYLLGDAAAKTNDDALAGKAFARAHQIDASHLPSLQGLAAVYYRQQDWEKAFKHYQMILVHHRDALTREGIVDTFYRLGVIKREQGERPKALNMFDKALEEDSHHRPTLEAVVDLYEKQAKWDQVIHFKRQLLDVVSDAERCVLLEQIGYIWRDKLDNLMKAIQAWEDVLTLDPAKHKLAHELLGALQSAKQWDKTIALIEQIASTATKPEAKAKYIYTAGVVYRDELKDPAKALEFFDRSLDLDPSSLKAFEVVNKLLTQQKDWKQLERAYRKMIHRVRALPTRNPDLEFNLLHQLGIIYRDRLKSFESAATAFEMARDIQPDNPTEHQILAEIYPFVPGGVEKAIGEHQWLLQHDPHRVDSYREMYKLYFNARQYDRAWCLASTLTFLKKADEEQRRFYEQYKAKAQLRPAARVDNEKWLKLLMHPDEDLYVGKIFEAITGAVRSIRVQPDKQFGLLKKEQADPTTTTATLPKAFFFAAQVLNLPMPRLFMKQNVSGGLAYAITEPPASVCGTALHMGFMPSDVLFITAKHLTYYRGEHYLRWILTTPDELKFALLGALRIVGLGPADAAIDQWAQQIRSHMTPEALSVLGTVARRFHEAGARTDIKRWMQTTELTACRAGFLLVNDLEVAARMISTEQSLGPNDLAPKDKVKELVLFSVSEQYFQLREALGITIQIG